MQFENIADVRVLVHTARLGSLTAAAAELGSTPAAASAALKRLEASLGTRLFERSTRSMRLTPAGQRMLDYAARALELLQEGAAQLADDRASLQGSVRVAAPSDLTRTVLLPWLNEFLQRHPGVQLAMSVGDRPLDVVRDEVDVALRYGDIADSRVVARRLADSSPVLAASPCYLARCGTPLSPLDLVQHNCLTFERNGRRHRVWRFQRDGHWTEVRVDGDRSVDDASLAREWAVAGAGIVLKSRLDLRADLTAGRLVALLPDWRTEPYALHALLPSARFVPARTRALIDFLAEKFSST